MSLIVSRPWARGESRAVFLQQTNLRAITRARSQA
nr:MAG TPA: hypothetical protein [Bacteriophage sp.]